MLPSRASLAGRHDGRERWSYFVTSPKEGRGLGVWFMDVGTAISEVPVNDQSVPVMFNCRSQDFQDVSISAQVWYTVTDPGAIAQRFDFSLNTLSGRYNADPLSVIQSALTSAAQEAVWSYVSARGVLRPRKPPVGSLRHPVRAGA